VSGDPDVRSARLFSCGYLDSTISGSVEKECFRMPEPQRKDAREYVQAQQKYYEQEIEHFRREIQTAGPWRSPTPITFVSLTWNLTFFARCGGF